MYPMLYHINIDGRDYLATLRGTKESARVEVRARASNSVHSLVIDSVTSTSVIVEGQVVNLARSSRGLTGLSEGTREIALRFGLHTRCVELVVQTEQTRKSAVPLNSGTSTSGRVTSPMPGRVLQVFVQVGQSVQKGSALVVVEAMKMENQITAERDGVVTAIHVLPGATVEANAALVDLAAP